MSDGDGARGPLAGSYWSAVVFALCALVPYLALSAGISSLAQFISADVHLTAQQLAVSDGMANAGYALGTVISVQMSRLFPPRRMLLIYVTLFLIGSVLAATATSPVPFIVGRILQGLCTSLTLIATVPPLAVGFPASRLPITNIVLGLGIFGAVAAGPVIGGLQANAAGWRPLFWIVVAVGAAALVIALLNYRHDPPTHPGSPPDLPAIALAGLGSVSTFLGAAELQTHPFLSLIAFVPLVVGVALIGTLLVYEYLAADPLIPVRDLVTSLPVAAVIVAVTAGAASLGVIELAQTAWMGRASPAHVGVLFLPEVAGALITSVTFGLMLRTRWLTTFTLGGMAALTAGIAVLTGVATGSELLVYVGSGLTGLGIGASVAPALITAGFALKPTQLQPVYSILELLRGVAAFAFGPVLLHIATTTGSSQAGGIGTGIWVCVIIAGGGGLLTLAVGVLGRLRPRPAEIESWLAGDEMGLPSPPLGAVLRRGAGAGAGPAPATDAP